MFYLCLSYRNASYLKYWIALKDKVDVSTQCMAYMLGLMDQPTSPVDSHIRELATHWSGRRCGGSLVEQVFERCRFIRWDWKTFDGFLRFCIHASFSDDFLQPRCFPRDLYAVNIAGNVRAAPTSPLSSTLFRLRMQRDHEKLFPGCCEVVPFLRNHLVNWRWCNYHWWFPREVIVVAVLLACLGIYLNFFRNTRSLRGKMISVVTRVQSPLKIIAHR